jgi:hypothetical protein
LDINTRIVKQYHPLGYLPQLRELAHLVSPLEDVAELCKYELHRCINAALMKSHMGEQAIKYALFRENRTKNLVAAFEINVQTSRLDFLTINGVTTSYEIKSELDTLSKLSKQTLDYVKAFEFNNVIVDERHLEGAINIIPEHFGIYTFHRGRKKSVRKATRNDGIDAAFQLEVLTKKELQLCFKETERASILTQIDPVTINIKFKQALKDRYRKRWQFITEKHLEILPLDVQFFFNTNVDPGQVYS